MAKSDKEIVIIELKLEKSALEGEIQKLSISLDKAKGSGKNFENVLKDLSNKESQLVNTTKRLEKAQESLGNEVVKTTKKMKQAKDATGATTSAAMELGRIASDMPYGIRGVANNMSQFASQMVYAAKTVDKTTGKVIGMGKAFKGLFTTMMGTTGVLFLIQGAIALMDYLYGANTKAESSTSSFTDSIKELTTSLGGLSLTQEVVNEKIEDYIKLQILRKKIDKEQKDSQDKLADANENVTKYQDYYNKLKQQRLDLEARGISSGERYNLILKGETFYLGKLNGFTEERNALYRKGIELANKLATATNTFKNSDNIKEGTVDWYKKRISDLSKIRDANAENTKEYKEQTKAIEVAQKAIEKLIDKKGNVKSKISIFKEPKEFNKDLEDYLKQVRDAVKKEELLSADNNLAKTLIQERYHIEDLKTKHKQNKEKYKQQRAAYKLELKAYLDAQVAKDLMSKSEAEGKLGGFDFDTIVDLEASDKGFNVLLKKWGKFYDAKKALEALKLIPKDKDGNVENPMQKEFDALSHYIDTYKTLMSGVTDFLSGESERQMTIEQNKTNDLNAELNNRLNNEDLSKEQRKSIQDQILNNDEKLRIKQDKIAKKQFNTAKAFNIAMAVVDTYGAANKVLNDPALTGQPWARGIMAAATIASGLANVAAISRQKFQSTSAATPVNTLGGGAGGGGGTGDRSFNFNLVGASQQNQLLSAIQSKFETPLKAFVVSKDITTQQELDVNIKGTATL